MPNATYQVHVDWERNANYTGTYDNISPYVRNIRAFTGFREPFTSVAGEQTLTIELDNSDRRFSPEYSSSPLYGYRFSGRPIRVQAINSGTTVLWTGVTSTITPQTGRNGEKRAILQATGMKRYLDKAEVKIPIQIGKRTDEIIQAVVESVPYAEPLVSGPWSVGVVGYSEIGNSTYIGTGVLSTSLDTGVLIPSYAGDKWKDGVTAYEAIRQVVESERGKWFFNRSGVGVFWNRTRLLQDYTTDATYTDSQFIQTDYVYGDGVKNAVICKFYPREVETGESIVWQLEKPLTVNAGTEKKLRARFGDQNSDERLSVINPVRPRENTVDFVATGTGYLISWKADAVGAEMVFVAPAGDFTINTLVIRGQRLTSYSPAEVSAVNGESVFYEGRQEIAFNLQLIDDALQAQTIADYEISRRSSASGYMRSVTLLNRDATTLAAVINRTVGDRIRVIETQTNHDRGYFIIGEELEIDNAGKTHQVTWFLEPANNNAYWLIGVSGYSEIGQTAIVAP